MGDFKIEINAVGGHGCDRNAKEGQDLFGCGRMTCPDCLTREFVRTLQRTGTNVKDATYTHWPAGPKVIVDDLMENKRKSGAF